MKKVLSIGAIILVICIALYSLGSDSNKIERSDTGKGNIGDYYIEIKDYAVVRNNGKHWSRYIQNVENMCKAGITWTFISSSNFAVRFLPTGFICDVAGSAIFPDDKYMNAICAFLNSSVVYHILKILNPTINFQAGNIASLPVEKKIFENKELVEITENNIEISKEDWDSFETSWDFKKHPLI